MSDSNREWGENTDKAIQLRHIRAYASKLRMVADKYEVLEKMASEQDSELAPVLAVAGRIATAGLAEAGELIAAMFPASNGD